MFIKPLPKYALTSNYWSPYRPSESPPELHSSLNKSSVLTMQQSQSWTHDWGGTSSAPCFMLIEAQVTMKVTAFWDAMPLKQVEVHRRFGEKRTASISRINKVACRARQILLVSCFGLPWRWRQYVLSKLQYISIGLHDKTITLQIYCNSFALRLILIERLNI
jgi:hypothetical protein